MTCPICLDTLKNPKVLPCGHTVCDTDECYHRLKRYTNKCPQCRRPFARHFSPARSFEPDFDHFIVMSGILVGLLVLVYNLIQEIPRGLCMCNIGYRWESDQTIMIINHWFGSETIYTRPQWCTTMHSC